MKRVAIIGAKGFLGRHLNWYMQTHMGITPECYDVVDVNEPHYHILDMTNKESVGNINLNIDYIFFMVGLTGTKIGFDKYENFVSVNEITLLNMLNVIHKSPYRPKVVFPSSRLVYKGIDKALREDDEKDFRTIYAVNKLACEGYLKVYSYNFNIPFNVFRICVPYGNMLDNNYSFGTIGFFIKMASEGKDITLYGDGTIKRTFTHLEDLCFQMVNATFNHASDNQIYNIGGETYSLHEVALMIASQYGVNVITVPWPNADLRIESGHTYFNDDKIQTLLGNYKYKHKLTKIK